MGGIYPAAPTPADIDFQKLHAFMKSPTSVNRIVNQEAADTFLSDFLFPRTIETNGSVLYEISSGVYLDREPEVVNPGGAYPRAKRTSGDAAFAKLDKTGIDVPVTDEKLQESAQDEIKLAAQQVGRHVRRSIDTPALTAAATAITGTVAATAAWGAAGAAPWLDIMTAVGQINDEDEDYEADTCLVTWAKYAPLAYNLLGSLPREDANGVVNTGKLPVIAGITIAPARLPAGVNAMVVDRKVFGARAYRNLQSPEYVGDSKSGIETWSRRDPVGNDAWLIRGRRIMMGIVQEPRAGRKITGV